MGTLKGHDDHVMKHGDPGQQQTSSTLEKKEYRCIIHILNASAIYLNRLHEQSYLHVLLHCVLDFKNALRPPSVRATNSCSLMQLHLP